MSRTSQGALKELIGLLASGATLSQAQAETAFATMMAGDATPAQMGGLLLAMRVRGETVEEITGGALAMRERMARLSAPDGAIDVCGTGGDASGSYNVSTAVGLVVAACGVPVAKHGNRALSSKSGSAEALAALGVDVESDMAVIERAIREVGIGFMMAPRHHTAMRHVAGARVELGTRTIFNLLGPLCNPAGVRRQLLGVFAQRWTEPLAQVLHRLGSERAWVVCGSDGLDELTTTGASAVASLEDGRIETFSVAPEDAGLPTARPEDLKGGDPQHNAKALRSVLDGATGAYRDIVLLNAAASLIVAGRVTSLRDGASMAAQAIDEGRAASTLRDLVRLTETGHA